MLCETSYPPPFDGDSLFKIWYQGILKLLYQSLKVKVCPDLEIETGVVEDQIPSAPISSVDDVAVF